MSSSPPISIAIIGAGIGGITLAIALSKFNPALDLTIYESRPAFSEIGAGVGFGPNAVRALELIGPEVAEAYNKVCTANLWPEKSHIWYDVRDGKNGGKLVCEIETGPGFVHGGASRAHFLDGLVGLIPRGVRTEFGKKVVDVLEEEGGKMKVVFEDGVEVRVDAVVGCDGVRSTCRRVLLGDDEKSARAVYSGKYAYRKVVEMERAVAVAGREIENRTIFFGYGGHILMFPIRDGKFLNIVAFVDANGQPWTDRRWVIPASRDEVLKDYEGWDKPATSILELIDGPDKWALFDHLPAPTYTKGNFCILGDAAHASTPHSGAGAGLAVEDAYILAGLFSPDIIRSASDIKYALKAYDEVRRPRSQDIVKGSRRQGKRLELQDEDGSFLNVLFKELKTAVEKYMAWVWGFQPAEMLEEAKRLVGSYKAVNGC